MPLQLDIVTPEKKMFSGSVENVYLPGVEGEMGILSLHAGLITALKAGEVRYQHEGKACELAIGSGFAEINQKSVVILTDMALQEADIDEAAQEAAMKKAQEKLKEIAFGTNPEEVRILENLIQNSSAALLLKKKYRK